VKRLPGGASLANVIQFEDVSEEERKAATDAGLRLYSLGEIVAIVRVAVAVAVAIVKHAPLRTQE
jgi:hypothetical protein